MYWFRFYGGSGDYGNSGKSDDIEETKTRVQWSFMRLQWIRGIYHQQIREVDQFLWFKVALLWKTDLFNILVLLPCQLTRKVWKMKTYVFLAGLAWQCNCAATSRLGLARLSMLQVDLIVVRLCRLFFFFPSRQGVTARTWACSHLPGTRDWVVRRHLCGWPAQLKFI